MEVDQEAAVDITEEDMHAMQDDMDNLSVEDKTEDAANKAKSSLAGQLELHFDSDRLKIFYERIFPYKLFFKWLSYNRMKNKDA